jgi:hypothetical protein
MILQCPPWATWARRFQKCVSDCYAAHSVRIDPHTAGGEWTNDLRCVPTDYPSKAKTMRQ